MGRPKKVRPSAPKKNMVEPSVDSATATLSSQKPSRPRGKHKERRPASPKSPLNLGSATKSSIGGSGKTGSSLQIVSEVLGEPIEASFLSFDDRQRIECGSPEQQKDPILLNGKGEPMTMESAPGIAYKGFVGGQWMSNTERHFHARLNALEGMMANKVFDRAPMAAGITEILLKWGGMRGDIMQIVLEGKTLGDCAKQAEAFLNEFESGESADPSEVSPPSTRKRGRRTNAEIVADAQAAGQKPMTATGAPTPAAAPAAPKKSGLTLPNVQQAMRELITHLGKGDVQAGAIQAKAIMEKEFAPHLRATDLPESVWDKFVGRVEELTRPAAATATADSLI